MNKFLRIFIIVAILAGLLTAMFFGFKNGKLRGSLSENPPAIAIVKTPLEKLQSYQVFSQPLPEGSEIGFGNFLPDGKYFAYSVFDQNANQKNQGYLVDLKNGSVKGLGAMLSRAFHAGDYLSLQKQDSGLFAYNPNNDQEVLVSKNDNAYDAFVSPDGKRAAVNGGGFAVLEMQTDESMLMDSGSESGGYAWFSDSNRILGFKQNAENLHEAGRGRDLGIWNSSEKTFQKLPVSIPVKTVRYAEWLVPDHVARVNAGYDDGSYDYLVNVDTNSVIDLGETSQALNSGITVDPKLGLMAVMNNGGAGDCSRGDCSGFIADQNGIVKKFKLARDHWRSGVQIISRDKLLYIRRDLGEEGGYGATSVYEYDLPTGKEIHIADLPDMNIVALSISPDKSVWIAGAGDRFFTGAVQ